MEHVKHAGNQTDRLQETIQAQGRVNEKRPRAKDLGDRLMCGFHSIYIYQSAYNRDKMNVKSS